MSLNTLQEYTRIAKYARYLPEHQRRETWKEQVDRVFDMHREYFTDFPELLEHIEYAEAAVLNKDILGSQRILQFGGDPIIKHNARVYNCAFGHINRTRAFQELMYLLLCGCGVGFSVQTHHIAQLPPASKRNEIIEKIYVVPDSIEGWSDAIGVLISSYMGGIPEFDEYIGEKIKFDYSNIRPAGAPLSSGAKAPGPGGLQRAIEKITSIFENSLKNVRKIKLQIVRAS